MIARFNPLQTWLFEQRSIEVPIVIWGAPAQRWFRVSAHAHNAIGDYERLADALVEARDNIKSMALSVD